MRPHLANFSSTVAGMPSSTENCQSTFDDSTTAKKVRRVFGHIGRVVPNTLDINGRLERAALIELMILS